MSARVELCTAGIAQAHRACLREPGHTGLHVYGGPFANVALESYDTSDNPAPLECLTVHGTGECTCFPACFALDELERPREECRP